MVVTYKNLSGIARVKSPGLCLVGMWRIAPSLTYAETKCFWMSGDYPNGRITLLCLHSANREDETWPCKKWILSFQRIVSREESLLDQLENERCGGHKGAWFRTVGLERLLKWVWRVVGDAGMILEEGAEEDKGGVISTLGFCTPPEMLFCCLNVQVDNCFELRSSTYQQWNVLGNDLELLKDRSVADWGWIKIRGGG
jgi:hypothetical protein